ncbi:MAG: SDR family NAD(P)-dependent oxidoreductase [Lachnospiraceae bacterium]|nr:SDR family NAD(P)-dependent oxidoreductase [Lachnospiraceae bacterium]
MAKEKKYQIESGRPLAVVTGASRGIGAAIAEALAEEGYDLVLTCSETISDLKKLGKKLEKEYDIQCRAEQCDVGDWQQVSDLFGTIGRLEVLINNAGISHIGLLSDMTPQEWENLIRTNLTGSFHTCKCAIPLFLQQHSGRILNISSVWGTVGASMEVAYSASKGGLNSFTRALAKELAPSGIAVNAIACGVIDTQMNAGFSAEEMEALRREIPADRIGKPEEVAQLALKLLQSPVYMTGQIVTMDGGWT